MSTPIRWGILATGSIAHQFAGGLAVIPDAELTAVGSRTVETANAFADQYNVPRRYASYEELAADPDVDVIYVATPHPFHKENSLLCLDAGKAVLCEKPFTMNAREAEAVVARAREKGVFLMEAMWTRFLPISGKVRQWISEKAIGDVRMIAADFGYRAEFDPEMRAFNPDLGGGGLLDVGVYPIAYISMILGPEPDRIASLADLGDTGVDEQAAVVLGYPQGELALLSCAVRTDTPNEVRILGTNGQIHLHPPFFTGTTATLKAGNREETVELPLEGNGYNYQAVEVMKCLRDDRLESGLIPLDETVAIMNIMDRIRSQWGLKYPME